MPRFKIVIWYPTSYDEEDWGKLALKTKLAQLEAAAAVAKTQIATVASAQGLFLGPEYLLSAGYEDNRPVPLSAHERTQAGGKLAKMSRSLGSTIFIPGSMLITNKDGKVESHAVAYYNAEARFSCTKKDPVGETADDARLFVKGNGGGAATIAGVGYGLQICRDASRDGYLTTKVDVHIAVSAGLALSNLVNPGGTAPRLRIVAERGGARSDRAGGGVEIKAESGGQFAVSAPTDLADTGDVEAPFNVMKTWDVQYTP
ncbi:MAG: hypothetical protein QM820_34750 [Minicystis sp.]